MKKYLIGGTMLLPLAIWALLNLSPAGDQKERLPSFIECHACQAALPDARGFSYIEAYPPHYQAYLPDENTPYAYLFKPAEILPDIKGYGGIIDLFVTIDTQGTILTLSVLSHSETPSYVESLEPFLKQFISLGAEDPLELGKDIDGITRATVTSEAITKAVRESLAIIEKHVIQGKPFEEKPLPLKDRPEVLKIKKKIKEVGLSPQEAKYWKTLKKD